MNKLTADGEPHSPSGSSSSVFKVLAIFRPCKLLIDLLKLELSHQGYVVEVAHNMMSGLSKCQEFNPDLIILDWTISDFAAVDLGYRLRSYNHQTSILVITNNETRERVAALEAGADDSISIPFAMSEFIARVRVQLRKHQLQKPSVLMFENLKLDSLTREVYRGDRYIYLTTTEFNLLEYLLSHPRQVLTRTQIIERIWGYDFAGDSNIIEVYIRYLRLKLEKNQGKRLIHTVRGIGYVLRQSSFVK